MWSHVRKMQAWCNKHGWLGRSSIKRHTHTQQGPRLWQTQIQKQRPWNTPKGTRGDAGHMVCRGNLPSSATELPTKHLTSHILSLMHSHKRPYYPCHMHNHHKDGPYHHGIHKPVARCHNLYHRRQHMKRPSTCRTGEQIRPCNPSEAEHRCPIEKLLQHVATAKAKTN